MMGNAFWSHTIWFILLGLTTIIELIVIFSKVTNRKPVFAVYLTISGMAFCFEMVVLSYLKAYTYYPMLLPHSPPDDSIAGNIFSQFSVTATALLIAVLKLKYYWYFIFALLYGAIEELFLALGVYKQNWYQTWMTVVFLLILFWVTKHVYRITFTRLNGFLRYVFIFLGLLTLHQHTIVWIFRIIGIQRLSEKVLSDTDRSLVLLSSSYMLLLGVTIMVIYFTGIRWKWKVAVILLLYFAHMLAMKFDLIIYKAGWFWFSTSISIWGMYLYTYILDKLYESRVEER
ncbi:hypothetical protein EKG37_22260 [Robertmurraya yapensis]|uniref:Uncharacterized protein n=2 Tax=Bacillus yapensis TaxID=2492960 RepID=A0A3S0K9Z7_9BACI|nr:hypothetical protein EKG37_22260 [Bacillus yapensis]TKS93538.1 hypothetical protein FAR12_22265 [Bacillus yapensis]